MTEFNLSERIKENESVWNGEEEFNLPDSILVEDVKEFIRLLKEEPKDRANSAQAFLIESGCGDLVLNDTSSREKWIYVSDIMIAFIKWKSNKLAGEKLIK